MVQTTQQHKLSVYNQSWVGYRAILEKNSKFLLKIFDRNLNEKKCVNVFGQLPDEIPCTKLLSGKQKFYCGNTCKCRFHTEIEKMDMNFKKRKQNKLRNEEYQKQLNAWIKQNPASYNAMLTWCKNDYKLGIKRISPKWLIEQARRRMQIKWDNSWTSLLARQLIKDCPDLKDVIEIRQRLLEG